MVVWRLHCMSSLGFEVQRAGLSVASDAQRAPAACDPYVDQFDPVDEVGSSARARRPMLRLGHQNTEVFGALTCLSLLRFRKRKKTNYFDNYSGFANSHALSVLGGG